MYIQQYTNNISCYECNFCPFRSSYFEQRSYMEVTNVEVNASRHFLQPQKVLSV
jgi:proteasome lid subunit RPN8/RPN11